MSISLKLIDFDRLFMRLKSPPLIINDVMDASESQKENLRKQIYTKYDSSANSDILSNLPSCECGAIVGEYHVGELCGGPNGCHTVVVAPMSEKIEPILWMRSPKGVAELINPHVWSMLVKRFTKSSFSVIEWITNTNYQPHPKAKYLADALEERGILSGYNYFVNNFDSIMEILFSMKDYAIQPKNSRDYLRELLTVSRSCIFNKYLPLPNKSLFIIEDTNSGKWVDTIIFDAVDAINTIASIDNSMPPHSIRTKENRTVKSIIQLAEFSSQYVIKKLAPKAGILRKNIYASRIEYSFRTVISSITDMHDYNEIHIPWGVAVTVFRYHLINVMGKLGYTVGETVAYLNAHTRTYSKLLDDIFKNFIDSSPEKGIPCTIGRNPSLERGSLQLVKITKIKTDRLNFDSMNVPSTAISINIVKGLNADKPFIR